MNTAREVTRSTRQPAGPSLQGRRKPLKSQVLGGYWRIPVFALIGALLAFSVSFVFKSQYSAVARLIIHPNDSSYAGTDSGADTGSGINIGGIDITKQTTLGNTLVNLATSNEAATQIVKEIGVAKINGTDQAPELGTTSKLLNFIKVGGSGKAPTAEEAAISHVQGALNVVVLDESWVMEITAWDPDPQMAGLIATTAAKVAVEQSEARFQENSKRELDYLTPLVDASRADVRAKAEQVQALQASATTPAQQASIAPQVAAAQGDLTAAQANNKALEERHAAVAAIVTKPRFDASQLGPVVTSTAPGRPLRYLFLLVGGLVGALAGLLLTWFRAIREEEEDQEQEQDTSDGGSRGRDLDGYGRPDVRLDEVIDVRGPSAPLPGVDGEEVRRPLVHQREAGVEVGEPGEGPPAPAATPTPEPVGRDTASDATLTPSEAGSIAAALFDRPGTTHRFSG